MRSEASVIPCQPSVNSDQNPFGINPMTDTQTTQSLSLIEAAEAFIKAHDALLRAEEKGSYRSDLFDAEAATFETLRAALSAPAVEGGETGARTYTQAEVDSILKAAFPLATPDERSKILATQSPAPTDGRLVFSHCPACARDDNGTGPDDAGVSCSASGPTDGCEAVWITRPTDGVEEAVGRLEKAQVLRESHHQGINDTFVAVRQDDLRLLLASRKGGA